VAILCDPESVPTAAHVGETGVAARALGVQLQSLELRDPELLENAFRAAGTGHAQALIVVSGGFLNSLGARIATLAVKARLPVMYTNSNVVLAGGLMSYGEHAPDRFHGAAAYVDRILKGAKPADLPVVQPTKFELVINLKAAKQIGLTIPPNLLARADKVIE
jgi:putative tryptophan/tyrosine transport system substrate-binding protein